MDHGPFQSFSIMSEQRISWQNVTYTAPWLSQLSAVAVKPCR